MANLDWRRALQDTLKAARHLRQGGAKKVGLEAYWPAGRQQPHAFQERKGSTAAAAVCVDACAPRLALLPNPTSQVAVMGFCLGGALAAAAAQHPDIVSCGIVFYGLPDRSLCSLKDVRAPLSMHFGALDDIGGFSDPQASALCEGRAACHSVGFTHKLCVVSGVMHSS